MWERTLQDLIRGMRSHADDEAKFVAQCMDECRKELKQKDIDMKAIAVSKLTYVRFFLMLSVFPRNVGIFSCK
jgi:AP-3 complex subunit delta-1